MLTLRPPSLECTFIVLDAAKWQAQPGTTEESCMVGDVNLFLTDPGNPSLGEIEVMIAGSFPPFWALDLVTLRQPRLHRDRQGLSGGLWHWGATWHPVSLQVTLFLSYAWV